MVFARSLSWKLVGEVGSADFGVFLADVCFVGRSRTVLSVCVATLTVAVCGSQIGRLESARHVKGSG